MKTEPSFTVGVEEEYMLVEAESLDLAKHVPDALFADCKALLGDQVTREFMQCQIEIGTKICRTTPEAQQELVSLRQTLSQVAKQYGLELMAASTHPFSQYTEQSHTQKERYHALADDLQAVVNRLLIGGMHVHVGIGDDDLRLDLMGQASYILPHLLALSTSSPFWCGHNTGLMSYRLSVWDEMPRTGLPPLFDSYNEYKRHVDVLVNAGIIENSSKIWWDIRPSSHFPTLEVRISDVCTRVEDAVCIASLFQCWLRMLYRLHRSNQRWRRYLSMLIDENRWRAHRYGINEGLIDFGRESIVPFEDLFEEMLDLIREDAEVLGCIDQIEHGREIIARGTSAHSQLKQYQQALTAGASEQEALQSVVHLLIKETCAVV